MSLLRRIAPLLTLLFTLFACTTVATGCECAETGVTPPCALFWRSALVFTAVVSEIDSGPNKSDEAKLVRLSVQKVFKGKLSGVVLDIQGEETDCHRSYERGQQYFIYADSYDKAGNMITTARCYGRTRTSHATEDLKYARELSDHLARSSISGKILEGRYRPLAHIRVLVKGRGKSYETTTDAEGLYKVVVRRPGEYRVTVVGSFSGVRSSFGSNSPTQTTKGIAYTANFVEGQCDYREVTVY